jgi:hypothetical protein
MNIIDYKIKNMEQHFKTTNPEADLKLLLHIANNLHLKLNYYIEHRGSIPATAVINWNKKLGDFLEDRRVVEVE